MIALKNIGVRRDDWVLRGIDLTIHSGDLIGIIGNSGAGKTTLLKVMSGLLDATEGEVCLDDKRLIGPSKKLIPGYEEIQLVNQDFALDLFHTVAENIKEKVLHLPKKEQSETTEELLDLLEIKHLENRQARYLSGGEQQRLCIARALACEPLFLLLDEPFVHLDQMLRMRIMHYLTALNEVRGTGIVLVSHDGSEMMGFVDKVVHLKDGSVDRFDSAHEVFYHPNDLEQASLMGVANQIELNGKTIIFRPSEFDAGGTQLPLVFKRAFDNGTIVFNYFRTEKGEEVVLTSSEVLKDLRTIAIKKRK